MGKGFRIAVRLGIRPRATAKIDTRHDMLLRTLSAMAPALFALPRIVLFTEALGQLSGMLHRLCRSGNGLA